MGLPRAKQGSWLWATLKRFILQLLSQSTLADDVTRSDSSRLQLGRLRVPSKNFCKGDVQPQAGTQRRDLQPWGFAVKSHSRSDVMLVTSCSEQEVRLGMSLPAVLGGGAQLPPHTQCWNNTWGQYVPAQHQGNNPCSPLTVGAHKLPTCSPTDTLSLHTRP